MDVTKDPDALDEVERLSGWRAVPVTKIGDAVVAGFDEAKLAEALGE